MTGVVDIASMSSSVGGKTPGQGIWGDQPGLISAVSDTGCAISAKGANRAGILVINLQLTPAHHLYIHVYRRPQAMGMINFVAALQYFK